MTVINKIEAYSLNEDNEPDYDKAVSCSVEDCAEGYVRISINGTQYAFDADELIKAISNSTNI